MDSQLHALLTEALGGEWSAICSDHFTPRRVVSATQSQSGDCDKERNLVLQ